MKGPTVVYTSCGGPAGWSILRSLDAVGRYRLVGVENDSLASGLYADAIEGRYCVPRGDAATYVERLLEIVEAARADVLWPCADLEVLRVTENRTMFEALGVTPLVSPVESVRAALDKPAMTAKLAVIGVPVPATFSLDERVDEFPFPVIVRPRIMSGGKDVHFFDDEVTLRRFRDEIGEQASDFFVQEKLAVQTGHMHMAQAIFDREGHMVAFFMSRSIRTLYPWGGPGLGGVPVRTARLRELAHKVFEATGPWFGPINVEFLYVPARNDFYFVEINPRYWGYSYLATAAGINFPDISVRLALGEDVAPVFDYRIDVVTMTSPEQKAFPRQLLIGPLPGDDVP